MRTTTAILLLTFTLSIFTNCNNNKTKQREAIQHFADAYFNYQLDGLSFWRLISTLLTSDYCVRCQRGQHVRLRR